MATSVSHEMRRYPTSQSQDTSYSAYTALRSDSNGQWSSSTAAEGGSALSRSMRYAEPWLYGSVRTAPAALVLAYPAPPPLVLCTCTDYTSGTKRSKKQQPTQCKKCKGTRLPVPQGVRAKYGTVRGYPTAPVMQPVRAGTVRVGTSSRPSILPSVDPYDLMRRSRLTCSDASSQFRARSISPGRAGRSKRSSTRSPSPAKTFPSRRSILECEVNPYDLMSKPEGSTKTPTPTTKRSEDYEDVEPPKKSQIPKLQAKKRPTVDREREDPKYKGILKKSAGSESSPVVPPGSVSKSCQFYLPLPASSPRKKVQFLVEGEPGEAPLEEKVEEITPEVKEEVAEENEVALSDDDDEPCRLKRSFSERLSQGGSAVVFHDTMALRSRVTRPDARAVRFGSATDLQRLDGVRTRPRDPPPPPPPTDVEVEGRPATPPPRSVTEEEGIRMCGPEDVEEIRDEWVNEEREEQEDVKVPEEPLINGHRMDTVQGWDTHNGYNHEDKVVLRQRKPSTTPILQTNGWHANDNISKQISNSNQTNLETNADYLNVPSSQRTKDFVVTNGFHTNYIQEDPQALKQRHSMQTINDDGGTPPSAPPRKRSVGRLPGINRTLKQPSPIAERILKEADESLDKIISESCRDDSPRLTVKFTSPDNSMVDDGLKVNGFVATSTPDGTMQSSVRVEPSKTVVQISSPWTSQSVHRLQIKNEFENRSVHAVSFSEPQRKTSIMINGDECYSTVNVNDDVPIYQSSVVVNDYDCSKVEVISGTKSSVYITGDFQGQTEAVFSNDKIESPKKTFVILESSEEVAPDVKEAVIESKEEVKEDVPPPPEEPIYECPPKLETEVVRPSRGRNVRRDSLELPPTPDDIQRLLKDPVEAVKHNLVPHVCGRADVERRPRGKKSFSSNTLVARLLEDPFLGSLAEGLETDAVAKLIEDSLLKLRHQDSHEDDKDGSESGSCPPYEMMDPGSDCYSNHSNRSSVTEEELGARSKFYQLLADSSMTEVDDHHYEIIRPNVDPIYEEIEIPPPLPTNPPPPAIVDDLQIDKQFTTRSIFEGASKYDILSYLVDAKERGIVPEEGYAYSFGNSGDVIVEEEDRTKPEDAFSSRVSHASTVSDSSEDSSLVVVSGPQRPADIERNDSGVGSETSKCSRSRYRSPPEAACEDCDLAVELAEDDGLLVCRKCSKRRAERKDIITEIVETEEKYSRDLQIILEEFYQPMLVAGLLTPDQLSTIFLNVEELLENSQALAERLRDSLDIALDQGDEDLLTVNIGKIFLEAAPMLHAFESYCVRQAGASLLLAGLEKDKELLRIFLRVSQMENAVLRRMNLNSFLMVPVQRVTKYPLLLARLYKVTPAHHDSRELLREAQHKVELHLSHMNSEARDVPGRLWRRISSGAGAGRRHSAEVDLASIKLRKIAVDVLEWNHDEARFALEGRLLYTQPADNNWRKGRTIKLAPVNALLVTNGKPGSAGRQDHRSEEGALAFPRHTGIREAALLLVRDKGGRYSLLREPLYLDRCVVATDPAWQSYFEVQELLGKDTFIFKAEDPEMTRTWYRQLQYHAQGMGQWRKRRNALANIMINGMGSRS